MSTKQRRKYGPIRAGAETSAGTNDDVFDKFFGPEPDATPTAAVPHTREVPHTAEPPRTAEAPDTSEVSAIIETPEPVPAVSHTFQVSPTPAVAGYWSISNDITDTLWPVIRDPYAQSVLVQLLRLSWGYHKDECTVGLQKLADRCGFHKNQARKGKRILLGLGVIAEAGEDNTNPTKELRGTRFKILIQPPPTVKVSRTAPVPNKVKALKDKSKKVTVCDRCKDHPGMWYPEGYDKGVKICRHEKLASKSE